MCSTERHTRVPLGGGNKRCPESTRSAVLECKLCDEIRRITYLQYMAGRTWPRPLSFEQGGAEALRR